MDIDRAYERGYKYLPTGNNNPNLFETVTEFETPTGYPSFESGVDLQLKETPKTTNSMIDSVHASDNPLNVAQAAIMQSKINDENLTPEEKDIVADGAYLIDHANEQSEKLINDTKTLYEKIQEKNTVEANYKMLRDSIYMYPSKEAFDEIAISAKEFGITREGIEYDYWSNGDLATRKIVVTDKINGVDSKELWSTLTSMRLLSPGTGKAILTSNIIDDLIDDSIISKQEGAYLKKLELTGTTEKYVSNAEKLAAAAAGTKKASKATKPTWKAFTFKAPAKITPPKIKALPKSTLPKIRFTTAVQQAQAPTYKKLLKFKKPTALRIG
jgi:hypothetical protein